VVCFILPEMPPTNPSSVSPSLFRRWSESAMGRAHPAGPARVGGID
jgi:hypothetical protein